MFHLQDFALEHINAVNIEFEVRGKDFLFEFIDFIANQAGDLGVAVHHHVQDLPSHGDGPELHQVLLVFDRVRQVRQLRTVANGDDEVRAHNHLDFARGNNLALIFHLIVVAVIHRAGHHKELVIVALQLRSLVGHDGVFHDELVDAKLRSDLRHLGFIGLMQAHPDEPAAVFRHGFQGGMRGILAG